MERQEMMNKYNFYQYYYKFEIYLPYMKSKIN